MSAGPYVRMLIVMAACLFAGGAYTDNMLPTMRLQIGMHIVQAEIANSEDTRSHGLMGRTALPGNSGMLFVFEHPDTYSMWMKNTLIPLSVAFIDEKGVILNIEEMKPLTETVHPSAGPAKFALEMSGGWFAKKGVKPGDRFKGLESAPAAR